MNPLFLDVAKSVPSSFVFLIKKVDSLASGAASFFLEKEIVLKGKILSQELLADIQDIIKYNLRVFREYCAWLFSQF